MADKQVGDFDASYVFAALQATADAIGNGARVEFRYDPEDQRNFEVLAHWPGNFHCSLRFSEQKVLRSPEIVFREFAYGAVREYRKMNLERKP